MNSINMAVITLLKSAITGEKLPLPDDFGMEQVMPVLKKHGIQTMGYIGAVNCGVPKTDPVMQDLFRFYCRSTVASQRQLDKIDQLFAAFEENGIDYMPLKGTILKHLYPSHELRPMGDADILIRVEQYDRIGPVMEGLGFAFIQETDHELHWDCPELHVELHKRLIPSSNQDLYAYYGDGWQLTMQESGHRFQMTLEDQFVFLFTHFTKHFRGGGIGCRHVVDLWVFLRKYHQLDQTYISWEFDKLHLTDFYRNMRNLIDAWFAESNWDDMTGFISDFIFSSGVWGGQKSHDLAANAKDVQKSGKVGKGKWRQFFSRVFPSLECTSFQYPVLKKMPILLPIIWIVRWFHILIRKPDLMKRRVQMLNRTNNDEIIAWEQNMSYVGLQYWHDS